MTKDATTTTIATPKKKAVSSPSTPPPPGGTAALQQQQQQVATPHNQELEKLLSADDDADADLDNLLASAAGGMDVHDTPSSDAGQSPAAAATKQGSPDDVRILDLDTGGNELEKGSPVQPKNLNDILFDTTTTTTPPRKTKWLQLLQRNKNSK